MSRRGGKQAEEADRLRGAVPVVHEKAEAEGRDSTARAEAEAAEQAARLQKSTRAWTLWTHPRKRRKARRLSPCGRGRSLCGSGNNHNSRNGSGKYSEMREAEEKELASRKRTEPAAWTTANEVREQLTLAGFEICRTSSYSATCESRSSGEAAKSRRQVEAEAAAEAEVVSDSDKSKSGFQEEVSPPSPQTQLMLANKQRQSAVEKRISRLNAVYDIEGAVAEKLRNKHKLRWTDESSEDGEGQERPVLEKERRWTKTALRGDGGLAPHGGGARPEEVHVEKEARDYLRSLGLTRGGGVSLRATCGSHCRPFSGKPDSRETNASGWGHPRCGAPPPEGGTRLIHAGYNRFQDAELAQVRDTLSTTTTRTLAVDVDPRIIFGHGGHGRLRGARRRKRDSTGVEAGALHVAVGAGVRGGAEGRTAVPMPRLALTLMSSSHSLGALRRVPSQSQINAETVNARLAKS